MTFNIDPVLIQAAYLAANCLLIYTGLWCLRGWYRVSQGKCPRCNYGTVDE